MDVLATMQHRNREAIHDIKGIRSLAQNAIMLDQRDRDRGYESDPNRLDDVLRDIIARCIKLEEKLQNP